MSEKRFWFVIDKGKLDYVQDNVSKEKITVSELEDLLNDLSENLDLHLKNKKLQQERDYWNNKFNEGTETFESNLAEENELLKHTNEKLAIENANLEQSIKFLKNKINTLKETNLTLVKEIRKLPITDKQFKELNDKL